jgi:hypothetical protein
MDQIRRHLLWGLGLFAANRAWANDQHPVQREADMQPSSVKPRHVLCFLGQDEGLLQPSKAVARTIADFGFEIDRTYSQPQPDPHMERSSFPMPGPPSMKRPSPTTRRCSIC